MIERIRGILAEKSPTFVVVDVNGVGYGVNISAYTAGKLPEEGAEVTLYTNLVVREDSMTLFGFADKTEKTIFLMLIDVNGVGPKMAQRILSGVSPADLLNMIVSDNKSARKRRARYCRRSATRKVRASPAWGHSPAPRWRPSSPCTRSA